MKIWKRRILFGLISIALVGILGISVVRITGTLRMYQNNEKAYQSLSDEVVQKISVPIETEISEEESVAVTGAESEEAEEVPIAPRKVELDITIDFETLEQTNPDIVGWLYSPGTAINYPVVQGKDNSYYLAHNFEMQENKCGCLFIDADNADSFQDKNTVIHGHHMKNGSMFASLLQYQSQSYYNEHPVIFLLTPRENYEIDLFAGFTTGASSTAYQKNFSSNQDFMKWYYECMRRTTFNTYVDVIDSSSIITLSTCDYSYDDARYVVLGVLRTH